MPGIIPSVPMFTAETMTGTITSKVVNLTMGSNVGITVRWTGTPTGAFTYEVSNNYDFAKGSGDFAPIAFGTAPDNPAGSADKDSVSLLGLPFKALRFKYVASGSTGVLDAELFSRGPR